MIPRLPRRYVDHLVSPRRQGDLADAEAAGQAGSMVGGMGVRVTLAWQEGPEEQAVLRDASARVFASAAPVAPASCLMERCVGLTPEEALRIEAADVLADLTDGGGASLPEAVAKGAAFAVEAMRRALGAPGHGPADPKGPGVLVCRCLDVGDRQVRRAVAEGARTPEEVGRACGAGTGCGSCRPDVLLLVSEQTAGPRERPTEDLHPVARIAWARLGPLLGSQGLLLGEVDVGRSAVRLRVGRTAPTPSLTARGARDVARHLLREVVWERIGVEVEGAD